MSISDLTGRRLPVTKLTTPDILDLQSRRSQQDVYDQSELNFTSVKQQNFDSKVCISDAHDENIVSIIQLKIIIPKIADQRLDLLLESILFRCRYIRVGILNCQKRATDMHWDTYFFMCNVRRYVDVHYPKFLANSPVDVLSDSIDLN